MHSLHLQPVGGASTNRQELNGSGRAEKVVEFDSVFSPQRSREPDGRFFCRIVKSPVTITVALGLNLWTQHVFTLIVRS